MLSIVVFDPLGESKAGVAEHDVGLVIAAATNPIETPDGEHLEVRHVYAIEGPHISSELAARRVVWIGGEDAHARRVGGAVFGYRVADDVVRHTRDDFVPLFVQVFSQLSRAVKPLLLGGNGGEQDG
jgi:hypothetical protein